MNKKYKILKQDCIKWMNAQAPKSVDCIVTSPPYNLNVKYGGGQFQAFKGNNEGAPMVETEISLQFKEMETITRERIYEGF